MVRHNDNLEGAAAIGFQTVYGGLSLVCTLVLLACHAQRVDVSGRWSGTGQVEDTEANKEIPDRSPHPMWMILRQKGSEVTGTTGPDPRPTPPHIINGMLEGNRLTFQIPQPASHPYRESAIYIDARVEGDQLNGMARWPTHNKVLTMKISLKRVEK